MLPVHVPLPNPPPQAGEGKVQAATPDGGQAHGGVIDTAALTAAIRAGLARLDLDPDTQVALAFTWPATRIPPSRRRRPRHRGGARARGPPQPAAALDDRRRRRQNFGRILTEELGLPGDLISIDGVPGTPDSLRRCRRADLAARRGPGGDQVAVVFVSRNGLYDSEGDRHRQGRAKRSVPTWRADSVGTAREERAFDNPTKMPAPRGNEEKP